MGSQARFGGRRAPAARATVAASVAAAVTALVATVATVLVGPGHAQAEPVTAGAAPAAVVARPAPPQATPTRPAPGDDDADRDTDSDTDSDTHSDTHSDGDRARSDRPGGTTTSGLRAAAPAPRRSQASEPRPTERTAIAAPAAAPTEPPPKVDGTPCTPAARACVDLDKRIAWLIDSGNVVRGPVPIQHGDRADPTPRGTFKVQWKAEQYTSRQYLRQMPYSVFFADGGIAFHEGQQDTPSAGCVKLGHEDAQAWFAFLQVGDEVQIH